MNPTPFYLTSPAGRIIIYRQKPLDIEAAQKEAAYRDEQLAFNLPRFFHEQQQQQDAMGFRESQRFMGEKAWRDGKPPRRQPRGRSGLRKMEGA